MTQTAEPTPEMISQAAYWAAELAGDTVSDADRQACEAWCGEHPLHRIVLSRMRGLDAQIDRVEAPERVAIDRLLSRRSNRRKAAGLLSILLLASAGTAGWQSWSVRGLFPEAATQRGELRQLALADGRLQLDTDSAVDVKLVDGGSHVSLFRGRVLARVTPGHVAPFVVETPEGTASALGTAFVVDRRDGATIVTVIESHVRACARGSGDCRTLAPGQRASIERQRVSLLADVAPRSAATWSEGWLVADDRPVVEVLGELNRYRAVPVRFDPARLTDVRVSGSFPLTDTDHALDGVARATGLRLDRADAEVVIDRR